MWKKQVPKQKKKKGRPKGSKNKTTLELNPELNKVLIEKLPGIKTKKLSHIVGYRYKQNLIIPEGYYVYDEVDTERKAENRLKKLKNLSILKQSKELGITEIQAKTLQFKIFSYRVYKSKEQPCSNNDSD